MIGDVFRFFAVLAICLAVLSMVYLFTACASPPRLPAAPPTTPSLPWCVTAFTERGLAIETCTERKDACEWIARSANEYRRWLPLRALGDCREDR